MTDFTNLDWKHIVDVDNGKENVRYINSKEVSRTPHTESMDNSTKAAWFSKDFSLTAFNNIDVYNKPLTPYEMYALYVGRELTLWERFEIWARGVFVYIFYMRNK